MNRLDILLKCDKCGELLRKRDIKKDEVWDIYESYNFAHTLIIFNEEKCDCGGRFKICVNKNKGGE